MRFFEELLREVRSQSHQMRHLMFGLSVIATVSLIGLFWFSSFSHSMYALLNPATGQASGQPAYAAGDSKVQIQRSWLGRGMDSLRAAVYSVLHLDKESAVDATPAPVYVLPLSNDK